MKNHLKAMAIAIVTGARRRNAEGLFGADDEIRRQGPRAETRGLEFAIRSSTLTAAVIARESGRPGRSLRVETLDGLDSGSPLTRRPEMTRDRGC